MPDAASQSFARHARYVPVFHFFALPVLLINGVVQIVAAVRAPGTASAWAAVVAIAIALAVFYARWMPLQVQDRVIRLEETLRLQRLMPGRDGDIAGLTRGHLVALRFASDAEVPGLVDRIRKGEITTRKDIKRAVQTWRPDYLRA